MQRENSAGIGAQVVLELLGMVSSSFAHIVLQGNTPMVGNGSLHSLVSALYLSLFSREKVLFVSL